MPLATTPGRRPLPMRGTSALTTRLCDMTSSAIKPTGLKLDSPSERGTDLTALAEELSQSLRQWFGVELSISCTSAGHVLHRGRDQLAWQWPLRDTLLEQVDQRRRAEFIEEEGPFVVLALPQNHGSHQGLVAWGVFITASVEADSPAINQAARTLGVDAGELRQWAQMQTPIAADTLDRLAGL